MHHLDFGEAAQPHAALEGDKGFLSRRKDFARGEIHLRENMAPMLVAFGHVRAYRFAEAIAVYDEIIKDVSDKPHVWINRGVALQATGRVDDALESYEKALAIAPYNVAGLVNRAIVLQWMARNEEALADYAHALDIEPDNHPARLGLSVVLSSMLRNEEALAQTNFVLEQNPGSAPAHYNKALILLAMGEYAEGFREHEWRFGTNSILGRYQFKIPRWLGQPTKRPILIHCEQGLGDQIQFLRYIPALRAQGLDVHLECPPTLLRLCEQLKVPAADYENRPKVDFGYHCPIISLAAIFGTTVDTVPLVDGYLRHEPALERAWDSLFESVGDKRVGLCWSSGVRKGQVIAEMMQRRKSIPTPEIISLIQALPQVTFVSLQKDAPIDGVVLPPGVCDPMPGVEDLADTAAVISHLDLVVTVDSAVAHLAGAMGKPVWVLNRADICWRWLSGSKESPWYSSARIYRQAAPLQWGDVMGQLKRDLSQWAK